jgi:hypothetical protein
MHDRKRLSTLVIALAMSISTGLGQKSAESLAAQKSTPALERARLFFLVGSFSTYTTMPPSANMPKGATGTGTSTISWALDSLFLSIEEESVNPLFGHYKGHGMLGFDANIHEFVLSMFNNFGDHPTYHGTFAADTLILQTKVPARKGTFDQKLLWYREGEIIHLKVLNDYGKGFLEVLDEASTPVAQKMN